MIGAWTIVAWSSRAFLTVSTVFASLQKGKRSK
jgi:hypothetical protein